MPMTNNPPVVKAIHDAELAPPGGEKACERLAKFLAHATRILCQGSTDELEAGHGHGLR